MTANIPLTMRVQAVIEKLFAETGDRETVRAILLEECGESLPLAGNPDQIERIQLAVLKVSRGEAGKFLETAALAQMDWRDVLMAAGFGSDVEVHIGWAEKTLNRASG
jgi:hypothetical protein